MEPLSSAPLSSSPTTSSFSFLNYFWPTKEIQGSLFVVASFGSGSARKIMLQLTKNDVNEVLSLLAKEFNSAPQEPSTPSAPNVNKSNSDPDAMLVDSDGSDTQQHQLDQQIAQLIELGFEPESVSEAVHRFGTNAEGAIEWLLSAGKHVPDSMVARLVSHLQIASMPPYDLHYGKELPSFFAQFSGLRRLTMDKHDFPALPDLSSCNLLEELHLKDNRIRVISDSISNLKSLRVLTLSNNLIVSLPVSLLSLAALAELDLSNNQLSSIPDGMKSLVSLTRIDLRQNRFAELPPQLFALPSIRSIHLENNLIKSVPNSFPGVPQYLSSLNLSGNRISWVSDPLFFTIESLKSLDLSGNPILRLSSDLGRLAHLQRLVLNDCKLEALPATLSLCSALEHLNASGNLAMASLPPEMYKLTALHTLDISGNSLTTTSLQTLFPSESLDGADKPGLNLRTLRLAKNKLSDGLPDAIGSYLLFLEELDVSSCEISQFASTLCRLTRLTKLDVSNNKLAILPNEFGDLSQLQHLNLNANPSLKDLPTSFGQLHHLRELSLANIRIEQDAYGLKSAHIIDPKLQKFSRLIRMCISSGGHPDLVFAMRHLASKQKYLKKMADRGVTQELLKLSSLSAKDHHVQEAALSTLLTIASLPENRQRLFEEPGLVETCCDIILHAIHSLDRIRLLACDIVCCLAFEESIRYKLTQGYPVLVEALRAQLNRSTESIAVIHHAQRALSALGDRLLLDRFSRVTQSGGERGIRLVCIDGGGTRGYVTILMLSHIEKALGLKVCELFDMIAGTSTGSIIAALAVQGISMEQMLPLYRDMSKRAFVPYGAKVTPAPPVALPKSSTVFAHAASAPASPAVVSQHTQDGGGGPSPPKRTPSLSGEDDPSSPYHLNAARTAAPPSAATSSISSYLLGGSLERLMSMTNLLRSKGYYQTKPFSKALKDLAGGKTVRLIDTAVTSPMKLAITSYECSRTPAETYVFRNYAYPSEEASSRYHGGCEALLWQAMRASSAAPGYYDEFILGSLKFIDGGVGANNPTAVAVHEARKLWPDRPLDLIVSCGNGLVPSKRAEASLSQSMLTVISASTETEKTHAILSDFLPKDVYFRLQPVDEAFDWSLDECRPEKFDLLEKAVDEFVAKNVKTFSKICEKLTGVRVPDASDMM